MALFSYDPTTPAGQVRLLLSDVDEDTRVFIDTEITAFLAMEGGSVKRAAAQAIDTNATNEVLASKVIKDHELSTDGAKAADAMRKHAQSLRDQADREYDDSEDGSYFAVLDLNTAPCGPELTGWY